MPKKPVAAPPVPQPKKEEAIDAGEALFDFVTGRVFDGPATNTEVPEDTNEEPEGELAAPTAGAAIEIKHLFETVRRKKPKSGSGTGGPPAPQTPPGAPAGS